MTCKHATYIGKHGSVVCYHCAATFPNKPRARHQFPAPALVRSGVSGWLVGVSPAGVEWVVYEPHKIGPQRDRLSELHARTAKTVRASQWDRECAACGCRPCACHRERARRTRQEDFHADG